MGLSKRSQASYQCFIIIINISIHLIAASSYPPVDQTAIGRGSGSVEYGQRRGNSPGSPDEEIYRGKVIPGSNGTDNKKDATSVVGDFVLMRHGGSHGRKLVPSNDQNEKRESYAVVDCNPEQVQAIVDYMTVAPGMSDTDKLYTAILTKCLLTSPDKVALLSDFAVEPYGSNKEKRATRSKSANNSLKRLISKRSVKDSGEKLVESGILDINQLGDMQSNSGRIYMNPMEKSSGSGFYGEVDASSGQKLGPSNYYALEQAVSDELSHILTKQDDKDTQEPSRIERIHNEKRDRSVFGSQGESLQKIRERILMDESLLKALYEKRSNFAQLSVVSPFEVLQKRILLEILNKEKIRQRQQMIEYNQELLKAIG